MPSSLVINCNLYQKTYQFHSLLLINSLPLNNAVNKKEVMLYIGCFIVKYSDESELWSGQV